MQGQGESEFLNRSIFRTALSDSDACVQSASFLKVICVTNRYA